MDKNLIKDFKSMLVNEALKDESFRKKLLENPHAAIEEKYEIKIAEGCEIIVVKDTPNSMHIVIPLMDTQELSEQELAKITGGGQTIPGTLFKGSFWDAVKSLFTPDSGTATGYKTDPEFAKWITKND